MCKYVFPVDSKLFALHINVNVRNSSVLPHVFMFYKELLIYAHIM